MNCFCDNRIAAVTGPTRNLQPATRNLQPVGDFDWGQTFQDLLGAGLKVGGAFALSELGLGGSQRGAGTQNLPGGLPQVPAGTPPVNVNVQAPVASPLPTWVLPVAVGGGLLVLALVLKR